MSCCTMHGKKQHNVVRRDGDIRNENELEYSVAFTLVESLVSGTLNVTFEKEVKACNLEETSSKNHTLQITRNA